jgi:hypothetical protein
MDWTYKAVLTAITVAAVLLTARLISRRVAGMLAGLPVITVPALLWLSQEQGADFAVRSAVGSAAACAMAPWFAWSFVSLARRHGAAVSLAGAALLAWAAVTVLQLLDGRPLLALVVAALSCVWVLRQVNGSLVRTQHATPRAAGGAAAAVGGIQAAPLRPGEPWLTAALAGAISAAVCLLAAEVGPYWSGVLSTLPLISACALVHLRRRADMAGLRAFVAGYGLGVLAKALFVCSFAWLAPQGGVAVAMVVAAAVGVCAALLLSHSRAAALVGTAWALPAQQAPAAAAAVAAHEPQQQRLHRPGGRSGPGATERLPC